MTHTRLVLSGFLSRRSEVALTVACITVSFLLFGMMMCLRQAFSAGLDAASAHRLRSQATSSIAALLPIRYAEQIAAVKDVDYVSYAYALPAAYQDDPSHLLLQALPHEHFFDMFPELQTSPDQKQAFYSEKHGLIAGPGALAKYGWKVGQDVVLQTNIVRTDASASWPFRIVGTYDSKDTGIPDDLTFMRYDYLNDSRLGGKDEVMGYIEHIGSPRDADSIAAAIDLVFAASSPRLRTQPENLANRKQLGQFGDFTKMLIYVAAAVFFSMLLLLNSVFSERVRERMREFAMMKAIGFAPLRLFSIVLAEAAVVTCIGAAAGLALAWLASQWARPHISNILPGFHFPVSAALVGSALALAFVALSTAWPARRAALSDMASLLRSA